MQLTILQATINAAQNNPQYLYRDLLWCNWIPTISNGFLVFGLFRVWYSKRRGYYCIFSVEDMTRDCCLYAGNSAEACVEWIRLTFERAENV